MRKITKAAEASEAQVEAMRTTIASIRNNPQVSGLLAPSTRLTRRPKGYPSKRINFKGGKV